MPSEGFAPSFQPLKAACNNLLYYEGKYEVSNTIRKGIMWAMVTYSVVLYW